MQSECVAYKKREWPKFAWICCLWNMTTKNFSKQIHTSRFYNNFYFKYIAIDHNIQYIHTIGNIEIIRNELFAFDRKIFLLNISHML